MTTETRTEAIGILGKSKGELQLISADTETQVRSVSMTFRDLAGDADAILNLAGSIVGCVENENVSSILPKVQTLSNTARQFIGERLQAITGILEMVAVEAKVLHELSLVTGQQAEIALKTKALSVLTNVEVAHLGAVGMGFQYLAHELAEFSKSLMEDAQALESHTSAQKIAIEETRRVLSVELPRSRENLARIEAGLDNDLASLESSLIRLSSTPAQFRMGVEDIAQQIAGVVSAIQSHDITRQQIEHVQAAFDLISEKVRGHENSAQAANGELSQAYAGLTIQIYQLRSIKVTVESWTSQIKSCMGGIFRVSASELVGIGPLVLEQERQVSSQLAHIEMLERESLAYSARIQRTLQGVSSLMQFVGEYVQRSNSIRDRLRLLSFNSIIEASHLGIQAGAVLAIAKTIKEISVEWSKITERSGLAMEEVQALVRQTNKTMEAFSGASDEKLEQAQSQTRGGLDNLRTAAAFAAKQSQEMEAITGKMQSRSTEVANSDGLLDACSNRIDAILAQLESVRNDWEADRPDVKRGYDPTEVTQLFAESYSTEMERDVLRAALRGEPLPVAQQNLQGNSAELF